MFPARRQSPKALARSLNRVAAGANIEVLFAATNDGPSR
jgi:hypothetical protein